MRGSQNIEKTEKNRENRRDQQVLGRRQFWDGRKSLSLHRGWIDVCHVEPLNAWIGADLDCAGRGFFAAAGCDREGDSDEARDEQSHSGLTFWPSR